jgi:hypothetical protein
MNLDLGILLPSDLQEKIIRFVNLSEPANWIPWDYEVDITSEQLDRIDRGRKLTYTYLHDEIANDVEEFSQRVITELGLNQQLIVPIPRSDIKTKAQGIKHTPHMVSVLFADSRKTIGIQKHTDNRNENGWYHVRFNFMVQSSVGGEPVILSTVYPIDECNGWVCFSSEWLHSALPVTGNKERIVLSLGYYIQPAYALEKYKIFF